MGVLDQKFTTAYLRFFDDKLMDELRNGFRPAENSEDLAGRWREAAHTLAQADSLPLLQAMINSGDGNSRYLHLRVAGAPLGIFDVVFNTNAIDQISVAQATSGSDARARRRRTVTVR